MRIFSWTKWFPKAWSIDVERGAFTEGPMVHRDCRAYQNPFALVTGTQ